MMQLPNNYIVAYGYNQQFKLTQKQAQDLLKATEQGAKIVKFDDLILSTTYSWIAPADTVNPPELDSTELALCEDFAEWGSRPNQNMDWSEDQALVYIKHLMGRIGYGEVKILWKTYANGAYPSVKSFLRVAKEISNLETPIENDLMLEEGGEKND